MKTLISALALSVLLFSFAFTGCGKNEDTTTTQKDSKNNTQTQQQSPPPTQTNTTVPKIGMIWNQIEKKSETLGQVIQAGKAPHLDEPIAEIITLIKTLPAKSTGLEQTKLDMIKSKINELEKLGISMDNFQHAKKDSEVKKEYEKFTQALKEIKNQFPPESFN